MPRQVSLAAMRAAMSQHTAEVYLVLCKIEHPNLPSPIYLVNNNENITSNGILYRAFPFEAVLPDDQEAREPTAEIRIDNISRELMDEIRSIQSPPTITLSVVVASNPDYIEWGPMELLTRGVSYTATVITLRLSYSAFTKEPFPYRTFNPADFPGMFN